MSKRYSGKSFKDTSVKKKPKLSFKEKRKLKRESEKNKNQKKILNLSKPSVVFFKFSKVFKYV